jgi:hypothetical protein
LIENGAEINVAANDNSNLLHTAAYNGNLDFIKKYAKYFDINGSLNDENMSIIDYAVCSGNTEIVNWLLDYGAVLRHTVNEYTTPLTLAKYSKNKETVKIVKDYKIKDIPYLYLCRISLGYDFIFGFNNFYMSPNVGLYEDRYGFNAELGFMIGGKHKWVLLRQNENVSYIIREKRRGIYIGLGKEFRIVALSLKSYISLYPKVRSIFFWGSYRGISDMYLPKTIVISPAAGIAINLDRYAKLFFESSYLNIREHKDENVLFNIGIKVMIGIRKKQVNEKYSYIINY